MIILLFQKYATCQLVIIIPNQGTRVQRTSLQVRYTHEMYRKEITLTDNMSDRNVQGTDITSKRNVQGTDITHVTTFLIH